MKKNLLVFSAVCIAAFAYISSVSAQNGTANEDGFVQIFNGKDLTDWSGNPALWSVKDGVLNGQTANEGEAKLTYNQFITWTGGEVENFIFKADIKISANGNSGFQYRSIKGDKDWSVKGYQADFDGAHNHSGILYGEGYGGILTERGTETVLENGPKRKSEKKFAESAELKKTLKVEDWNSYEIRAEGDKLTHIINGNVVSISNDEGGTNRKKGILAIQIHVTKDPMNVQIKNIRLKKL
ncbi:hypothetical protein FACS189427_00870 [Planctomycetales bacterium]|nr:hypothetical protein FACS189427_00870 [Planctomycetales bacterium]